jgi:hypothetical protein
MDASKLRAVLLAAAAALAVPSWPAGAQCRLCSVPVTSGDETTAKQDVHIEIETSLNFDRVRDLVYDAANHLGRARISHIRRLNAARSRSSRCRCWRRTAWLHGRRKSPLQAGAVEKTRTSTAFRPQRPQRCASTSSATTARHEIGGPAGSAAATGKARPLAKPPEGRNAGPDAANPSCCGTHF